MLRINVNNIFLEIDNSVHFEFVNSIFEQGVLQADWSFPFEIKWSDKNGATLGFANMLEVPDKVIAYQAVFYFGTKSFIVGRLILNGGGNDSLNSNIAGGAKGLSTAETNLKDLPYRNPLTGDGTIILAGSSPSPIVLPGLTTAALDYQTADYNNIIAFPPHSNPNFYGNANPDFQGIVNVVIAEDGTHPFNVTGLGGNKYCLVPFVYLFHVLETGFKQDGLVPSGTFWIDPEMKKVLLYSNYALDKASNLGCIVKSAADEIINIQDSPGLNTQRLILLNNLPGCIDEFASWGNVAHEFIILDSGKYDFRYTADFFGSGAGDFYVGILVDPIAGGGFITMASIMVTIGIGGTQAVDLYAIVPGIAEGDKIFVLAWEDTGQGPTNVTVLSGAVLTIRKYDDQVFNGMTNVVTIKNHVPDMTFPELLNKLKKWAQLDFVYDYINNKVYINYVEGVLSGPAELDLSSKLGKKYELLFDEKNKGYTVGYHFGTSDNLIVNNFKTYDASKLLGYYNSVDDLPASEITGSFAIVRSTNKVMLLEQIGLTWIWKEYTDNYYDVKTGNGETEVKTMLAPMMMLEAQNETNIAPDPANTRALIPAISEKGSSPVFDLGENEPSLRIVFMRGLNTPGGMYVLASATNYDQLGTYLGSRTMKMNDTDGLFVRLHEKIINALTNNDIVERDLLADINLLSDPRLKRKVSAGNLHWLLISISASIGKTIKISKSKWLKL